MTMILLFLQAVFHAIRFPHIFCNIKNGEIYMGIPIDWLLSTMFSLQCWRVGRVCCLCCVKVYVKVITLIFFLLHCIESTIQSKIKREENYDTIKNEWKSYEPFCYLPSSLRGLNSYWGKSVEIPQILKPTILNILYLCPINRTSQCFAWKN